MHIYDISVPVTEYLPVWPGDPQPSISRIERMEDGADCNVTKITMSVHLGTHVDAPFHFLGDGTDTVETLPLHTLTGRVYVLQMHDQVHTINAEVLEAVNIPPRTRRVLFKTSNSKIWEKSGSVFKEEYTAISPDGAEFLVNRGIKLVGIDYLSVAPYHSPVETHRIFLKARVIVLEGLNLTDVSPGRYSLYCLPLKIVGADGAPARVILVGV